MRDSIVNVRFAKGDWCGEIINNILQIVCYGNVWLKSIALPDRVKIIGSWAFSNCSSLTSVNIPAGVTEIGDGAFSWCKSLKSITLPDSVTEIGWEAFCGCESLESIIIPADVTGIGECAFSFCHSLTKITFCGDVEYIGRGIFEECLKLQTIEVCSKGMKEKMREYVKSWSIKNVHIKVVAQKDGQNGRHPRNLLGFGRGLHSVLHIGRNKGR